MFLEYLQVAFLMIRAKPVRSVLSWLGIYIGVLALVVILAIQEGIRRELENLYGTQGARIVLVMPGFDQATHKVGQLSLDDVKRLASAPGILSVLPHMEDEREARSPKAAMHARVVGIDADFSRIYRMLFTEGRNFLPGEVATKQPVCLLSEEAASKLFPFTDPLGAYLNIQGTSFQVIGVVHWNAQISGRAFMMDNCDAFVPISWLFSAESPMIGMSEVRVSPDIPLAQAEKLVSDAISLGDPHRSKLYMVMTQEKFFERRRETSRRTTQGLLAIAGISLLVGAIGVANVMLTSVTERTREVGIRKALGATRRDILMQFLVESSVLCASGGLFAILTGWIGIAFATTAFPGKVPFALPWVPMAACFALTLLIGLVAGLYPASRAAALSPAEALRYE